MQNEDQESVVRLLNLQTAATIMDPKDATLYLLEPTSKTDHIEIQAPATDQVKYSTPEDGDTVPPARKRNIFKNLIVISLGFLLQFTSYKALANIQSSLNSVGGLGVVSLSVTYGALVLSSLFLPSLIIDKLGCKATLMVSMACYIPYMAANFYASFYTLVPTALLVGLGGAPLWSAKCAYLSKIGTDYAKLIGATPSVAIARFFGVFFMTFQCSQIFGNLISSFVLRPSKGQNISEISVEQLAICGVKYTNQKLPLQLTRKDGDEVSGDEEETVDRDKVYLLCGIYVGIAVCAVLLLAFFVDKLPKQTSTNMRSPLTLLAATVRQWKDPKQLLLIPLTIFVGMEQAFMTGDFTKAFVTCSLGIHHVGFVMICYGIVDATACVAFDPVGRKLGRLPLFLFAASINAALVTVMFLWHTNPDQKAIFFVICGLWGMADGLWNTQINAFYGVTFSDKREAAFSNYRLWESLGFILSFAWSNFLFIQTKLYILSSVLATGILCYLVAEVLVRRTRKTENTS